MRHAPQLFAVLIATTLFSGCGEEPDPDAELKSIVADQNLADAEAIEKLAREKLGLIRELKTEEFDEGGIALEVTLHPSLTPNTPNFQNGVSPQQLDLAMALAAPVISSKDVVRYGRQRKLAKMIVHIKHTVLDREGKQIDADIFGFTLDKDSFDKYLGMSSIELMRGKAIDAISQCCTVDYNRFDQIEYVEEPEE